MAAINAPKKATRHHELREDTVVTLYARALGFYYANRKLVLGLAGGLLALAVLTVGYIFYQRSQGGRAQELLSGAEAVYERGEYRAALDGTSGAPGLLAIADRYGRTDAGNLARYYAADALFRLGEYDKALEYFEDYDGEENFIGASALAGRAAIYETKENFDRAGDLYREAALLFENELTSPQYLFQAGQAYENAKQFDDAREVYEMIRDRFADSPAAGGIDFYLARVEAKQGSAS